MNEVVVADRGRRFAWITGADHGGSTRWEYRFEEGHEGTEVVESFELTPRLQERSQSLTGRLWGALGRLIGESEENTVRGMEETLSRLKIAAETEEAR